MLLIGFLFFISCGKDCATDLCPVPNSKALYLRLKNQAGEELLTGAAQLYDTSEVLIFARRQQETMKVPVSRSFLILRNKSGTEDSIRTPVFSVSNTYAVYYLSLKGEITDSLYFGYRPSGSECCDLSTSYLDRVNLVDITDLNLPAEFVFRK